MLVLCGVSDYVNTYSRSGILPKENILIMKIALLNLTEESIYVICLHGVLFFFVTHFYWCNKDTSNKKKAVSSICIY